jgi:hypothetical protein
MRKPSPAMVVALAALFVALGGVGVAATGGNFILGHSNTAGNTTTLSSGVTTGPTLQVTNTGGKPAAKFDAPGGAPFSVGNAKKIQNLNADQLDGIDSSGFLRNQPDGGWHYIGDPGEPVFQAGWVNYDPATTHTNAYFQHAAYYMDRLGIVHLGGLIKDGGLGSTVFALPGMGLCPHYARTWAQISAGGVARVTLTPLEPTGTCRLVVDSGSNVWVSLDGISYRAWNAGDSS